MQQATRIRRLTLGATVALAAATPVWAQRAAPEAASARSAAVPIRTGAPTYGTTGRRPPGAAPLMGMNIGAKNYDDPAYQQELAKLDIVVLGFYPGWRGDRNGEVIRGAVQGIKAHNPRVLVGQYTVLSEAVADKAQSAEPQVIDKLNQEDWWLRNAAGQPVQWTTLYDAWEINITDFAPADAAGDRYPQWYAKWVDQRYFKTVPEFDFRYFDNFMRRSLVAQADWRRTGVDVDSTDPVIAAAYRRGQMATLQMDKALSPAHRLQVVNLDSNVDPEYDGQLNAAFLEALIGKSWSTATWAGWEAMMQRYKTVYDHLAAPKVVGFNAWGASGDYRAFRFGLASCLLGNGHYSHTLDELGYSTVPWFDEYEVPLGAPVDAWPTAAWQNGVWKREYANALVLVNPADSPKTITIPPGWRRFRGHQDPVVNSGQVAASITLPAQDGLVLVRSRR